MILPAPLLLPCPPIPQNPPGAGKLNHVVSFQVLATRDHEQIHEVEEAFRALKTKIPQIQKAQRA